MGNITKTIIFTLASVVCCVALKKVNIAKCCKLNEYLESDYSCVPKENNTWEIRVYFNQMFKKNELPKNWHIKENIKPDCEQKYIFASARNSYIPLVNGSVMSIDYNEIIHPGNYCLDYSRAVICNPKSNPSAIAKAIVRKCCSPNAIFSQTNSSCFSVKHSSYDINIGTDKHLVFGYPDCGEDQNIQREVVVTAKLHEGEILSNGSFWLKEAKILLKPGNFCLEHVFENSGRSPSVLICRNHLPSNNGYMKPTTEADLRFTLYPIGLAISAIFLALTLAAGSLLPANHHVLHWRCQTNHVACLLGGDVFLCITQLTKDMVQPLCISIACSMHFLFLAAFFWLNTMCFNIWWTFRDLRPQSTEKSQERLRLKLYHVYAWGFPLIITITAAILDLVPQDGDMYSFLRPRFGEIRCWFYGDKELLTFFYGPIGILLMINLALYALTTRELTCGLWKRELVKSTTERAALGVVCFKLVIVMGVTWIADIASWAVGGPQQIWYFTDLINCLQGVFIFIVVGLQPQVLSAVKRLWCPRNRQNGEIGRTNHFSSQGLPSMGDSVTNSVNTTKSIPLETSC